MGDNKVEGEVSQEVEQVASGRDGPGADEEGGNSPMKEEDEGSAGRSEQFTGEEDQEWGEDATWGEGQLQSQETARKKKKCESKKEKKKKKKSKLQKKH